MNEVVKYLAPVLSKSMRKGQCGRIAVFGGSQEYTGAPYFASVAALKAGADLSFVVCPSSAASVIKSYSPELIVYPTLFDDSKLKETLMALSNRLHAVVLGPGLGRTKESAHAFDVVLKHFKQFKIPIVIDADALYFVCEDISAIFGQELIVLTPNAIEFDRLYKKCNLNASENVDEDVQQLAHRLNGVTIVRKGERDIVSDGKRMTSCDLASSYRRCGGQGDLLSGSLAVFLHYASMMSDDITKKELLQKHGSTMMASYAACHLTRDCNRIAFSTYGRSMTTQNMIDLMHVSMKNLFG